MGTTKQAARKGLTGKPALLMARGSSFCPTENCTVCGKFTSKSDRLPTVRGFAHTVCLLATSVTTKEVP